MCSEPYTIRTRSGSACYNAAMRSLRHASLGQVRWEPDGWWEGEARLESGDALPFAVLGDERGPAEPLAAALVRALLDWRAITTKTSAFIAAFAARAGVKLDARKVNPLSIVFLSTPEHFVLEVELPGDSEASWRIEFEHGEPRHIDTDTDADQ